MTTLKLPKKPSCTRPPGRTCDACTFPAKSCPVDLVYTMAYKPLPRPRRQRRL